MRAAVMRWMPHNLQHYLSTHLTGAAAATSMLRRLAERLDADDLRTIVQELVDEQQMVRDTMRQLGFTPSTTSRIVARGSELVSRTARMAQGVYDEELRNLTELEAMITGIEGKKAMWRLLEDLTEQHPPLRALDLDALQVQAERQQAVVDEHRRTAGVSALSQPQS